MHDQQLRNLTGYALKSIEFHLQVSVVRMFLVSFDYMVLMDCVGIFSLCPTLFLCNRLLFHVLGKSGTQ